MLTNPAQKYRAHPVVQMPDRQWPSRTLSQAPIWLSTDLRDGNQALFEPMNKERKLHLFHELVKIGFKEIEVGFPSASRTDFEIVRHLIDANLIPEDVTPMVITQLREDLIEATVESVKGARRAIVHLYNAIAPAWREIVFGLSVPQIIEMVEHHIAYLRTLTTKYPETEWVLQYSPETFCMAELDVSLAVCNAAIAAWDAGPQRPMIVNLPTTVEVSTPNVFADQIEWMDRRLQRREHIVLSVHPHNDRGTGVACAELAMLAGAQRVEGCLFGNGERTGNVDLVTLAMNLYSQGIDPGLDFSDIDAVRRVVERCNQLPVHPRHPYAGDLVYTAFSGSHQDAIRKGFAQQAPDAVWDVPYLPVDPVDVGRSYEAVIRVNSQSGKGGSTYLLERGMGFTPPRHVQIEFSHAVQAAADRSGAEMTGEAICALFAREYFKTAGPARRVNASTVRWEDRDVNVIAAKSAQNVPRDQYGQSEQHAQQIAHAVSAAAGIAVEVTFVESVRAVDGRTAVFVGCRVSDQGVRYGVGVSDDAAAAVVDAVVSSVNRAGWKETDHRVAA